MLCPQAEEAERRRLEKEERLRKALETEEAAWVAGGGSEGSSGAEEEEDEEAWAEHALQHYCVVCEKSFKSERQLENHERCVHALWGAGEVLGLRVA